MIEKFRYSKDAEYPGRASVIFYKNGAAIELDTSGMPQLRSSDPQRAPYYMEAELNSPMIRLEPGASYRFDTRWYPVRVGKNFSAVSAVGVIESPLKAVREAGGLRLSGRFGVFSPGKLVAHLFDARGAERDVALGAADPLTGVQLDQAIPADSEVVRVTLRLNDEQGLNLGVLGEVEIPSSGKNP
jgi:hypothetical protein